MAQDTAREQFYGAVVPVRDLPRMRAFYRDVVQLGDPILDSNFWVEFKLPGNGILVLERRDYAQPPAPGQGVLWLLGVRRVDQFIEHLERHEVKSARPQQEMPGVRCRSFMDPEGNPFAIYGLPEGSPEA